MEVKTTKINLKKDLNNKYRPSNIRQLFNLYTFVHHCYGQFHTKVDKNWKNEVALFPALISLTDWFYFQYVFLENWKGLWIYDDIYDDWPSYFWNNATVHNMCGTRLVQSILVMCVHSEQENYSTKWYSFSLINAWIILHLLTHWRTMSTKRGLYDISYHNSWYTCRSRKIKEDSSTEREKSPLQFESIFITVQCTSRSQDFFLIKMIKKSSNWQCF